MRSICEFSIIVIFALLFGQLPSNNFLTYATHDDDFEFVDLGK